MEAPAALPKKKEKILPTGLDDTNYTQTRQFIETTAVVVRGRRMAPGQRTPAPSDSSLNRGLRGYTQHKLAEPAVRVERIEKEEQKTKCTIISADAKNNDARGFWVGGWVPYTRKTCQEPSSHVHPDPSSSFSSWGLSVSF